MGFDRCGPSQLFGQILGQSVEALGPQQRDEMVVLEQLFQSRDGEQQSGLPDLRLLNDHLLFQVSF
jgi:hypothetical protein